MQSKFLRSDRTRTYVYAKPGPGFCINNLSTHINRSSQLAGYDVLSSLKLPFETNMFLTNKTRILTSLCVPPRAL